MDVKINNSGNTANRTSSFIYAAYATHPFVSSAGYSCDESDKHYK